MPVRSGSARFDAPTLSLQEYQRLAARIEWLETSYSKQASTEAQQALETVTMRHDIAMRHSTILLEEIEKVLGLMGLSLCHRTTCMTLHQDNKRRSRSSWTRSLKTFLWKHLGINRLEGGSKRNQKQREVLQNTYQQACEEVKLSESALKRAKAHSEAIRLQVTCCSQSEKFARPTCSQLLHPLADERAAGGVGQRRGLPGGRFW